MFGNPTLPLKQRAEESKSVQGIQGVSVQSVCALEERECVLPAIQEERSEFVGMLALHVLLGESSKADVFGVLRRVVEIGVMILLTSVASVVMRRVVVACCCCHKITPPQQYKRWTCEGSALTRTDICTSNRSRRMSKRERRECVR